MGIWIRFHSEELFLVRGTPGAFPREKLDRNQRVYQKRHPPRFKKSWEASAQETSFITSRLAARIEQEMPPAWVALSRKPPGWMLFRPADSLAISWRWVRAHSAKPIPRWGWSAPFPGPGPGCDRSNQHCLPAAALPCTISLAPIAQHSRVHPGAPTRRPASPAAAVQRRIIMPAPAGRAI